MPPIRDHDADDLARRILTAARSAVSLPPVTDNMPGFDLDDAYRVAARVIAARIADGERPVGWKIGFTNRTIWEEYGVHAPIWGPMYDKTVRALQPGPGPALCELGGLVEPRIEPEIVLRIARPPHPGMDERQLLDCIDAIGHGCELVQSLFPGWRFKAADTVAAFALHGRYLHGPLTAIAPGDREHWFAGLTRFEMVLSCDDQEIDRGSAENVLGGPLSALMHFVRELPKFPMPLGLRAGDLVTTGTVTRAFPIRPGERWKTEVVGLPLPGMALLFT